MSAFPKILLFGGHHSVAELVLGTYVYFGLNAANQHKTMDASRYQQPNAALPGLPFHGRDASLKWRDLMQKG